MMIDKLGISVSGSFGPRTDERRAEHWFDIYRNMLLQQLHRGNGSWIARPSQSRNKFTVELTGETTTVSKAYLNVEWERDVVTFRAKLFLNLTRTLVHCTPQLQHTGAGIEALSAMSAAAFFARSEDAAPALTVDGNDNAIDRPADIRALLGCEDYAGIFVPIFEQKLRQWVMDVVAPRALGFAPRTSENGLEADAGPYRVRLNWKYVVIKPAEVYFERREPNAIGLLDRLFRQVSSSEAGSKWRRYGTNEIGGRLAGSAMVGWEPTNDIQQIVYAKTHNRVRIETRYTRNINKWLRINRASLSPHAPLAEMLSVMRNDAIKRTQWDTFCQLCEPPQHAMLPEAADFMVRVVDLARDQDVSPIAVLSSLLATGGIEETDEGGDAPPRLIRKLAQLGIIETTTLQRRRRPNAVRRFRLADDWSGIAERMRQAFVDRDDTQS